MAVEKAISYEQARKKINKAAPKGHQLAFITPAEAKMLKDKGGSGEMTEAGIKPTLLQDYYVTLGEQVGDGTWSFKFQIKPFIRWIWFGAFLIAFGTFVSSYRYVKRI